MCCCIDTIFVRSSPAEPKRQAPLVPLLPLLPMLVEENAETPERKSRVCLDSRRRHSLVGVIRFTKIDQSTGVKGYAWIGKCLPAALEAAQWAAKN